VKISQIFKNNEDWISRKLSEDADYFKKLEKGQNPDILYIGCSDSRVTAEEIMGMKPGEAFVHRNIANMVDSIDMNAFSVINYAVTQLKVDHIIVCGHYGCGGIKAAMDPNSQGILNPWLFGIKDVHRLHNSQLKKIKDPNKKYRRLVELNVQEQCFNLMKIAAVQKAALGSGLKIHGWVFDVSNGKIIDLKIDQHHAIEKMQEIYHLEDEK
jgi:carbonic anhydrase